MPKVFPTMDQLKHASSKVVQDFVVGPKRIKTIRRVEIVASSDGSPRLRVVSDSAFRPPKFPGGMTIRLKDGSVYALPIEWYYSVDRSDKQMWNGPSPVLNRPRSEITPHSEHAPLLNSEKLPPKPEEMNQYQLIVNSRRPQFVVPNFWSEPFHPSHTICVPFYETLYTAYTFKVPSDRLIVVNSISYQFDNSIADFEQFDIAVYRESEGLVTFRDMKVPGSTDPAEQYAFAGHYRPIPVYCRFDHDQTIVIQVRVKGLYPFTHTDLDPLGGCFTIALNGWMASLMDNRDGGARPVDMGDFNDIALGFKDDDRPVGEESIGGV